jgi:hypothetical protein
MMWPIASIVSCNWMPSGANQQSGMDAAWVVGKGRPKPSWASSRSRDINRSGLSRADLWLPRRSASATARRRTCSDWCVMDDSTPVVKCLSILGQNGWCWSSGRRIELGLNSDPYWSAVPPSIWMAVSRSKLWVWRRYRLCCAASHVSSNLKLHGVGSGCCHRRMRSHVLARVLLCSGWVDQGSGKLPVLEFLGGWVEVEVGW